MSTKPSRTCLCLALLASLWSSAAAATGEGVLILVGEGALALSPSSISSIRLDAAALARAACEYGDPESGGKVKCKVRVMNESLGTDDPLPSPSFRIPESIATPCGLVAVDLTLDPVLVQPDSMALTEIPEDPSRGVFAGSFKINATFHLTNLDTGRAVEIGLPLSFSLAGPWFLASPGEAPIDDNLLFLTFDAKGREVPFEGCIPKSFWSIHTYEVVEGVCEKCPEELTVDVEENCSDPDQ